MGASNIQELAELYKKRNRSVSPGTSRSSDPRKMTVRLLMCVMLDIEFYRLYLVE